MDKKVKKSLVRKVRRMWVTIPASWRPGFEEKAFEFAQVATGLLPFWMESDYATFDEFLYHGCSIPWRVSQRMATVTLTYYEIPSLNIWKTLGYTKTAQAAQRNQDGMREKLLADGLCVLDLLTMA